MKSLLTHSAIWIESAIGQMDSPETKRHKMDKVRVDVSANGESLSNTGSQRADSALLFFLLDFSLLDGQASEPAFNEGDEIVFNGHIYHISSIRQIYGRTRIHHLEVGLL